MRRIATHLEVRPGALYWHFANKQTMLAGLSDLILQDRPTLVPAADDDPAAAVRPWAEGLREVLLAHRDGAELVASVLAMQLAEISPVAELAALLPGPQAQRTASAVTHFVLGHCASEQGHDQLVQFGVIAAGGSAPDRAAFDHGIELLVRGIRSGSESGPGRACSPAAPETRSPRY